MKSNTNTSIKKEPHRVAILWDKLGSFALGRMLFSFLLGRTVPYSGTIRSSVLNIGDGKATLIMKDRKGIRNHLKSIHAIALANLGELASGLAMFSVISNSTRAIVVDLDIHYFKKARGRLTVVGQANPPDIIDEPIKSIVTAEIKDDAGDVVAKINVHWLLSPPIE